MALEDNNYNNNGVWMHTPQDNNSDSDQIPTMLNGLMSFAHGSSHRVLLLNFVSGAVAMVLHLSVQLYCSHSVPLIIYTHDVCC